MASRMCLKSFCSPTHPTTQGKLPVNFQVTFGCMSGKGTPMEKKFQLNCSRDKEMDLSASALIDSAAAECVDGRWGLELPPRLRLGSKRAKRFNNVDELQ
ncbi:hypothetical protein HAX54_000117 [Datura stramonium]|uniref:Uncharacterized protein n=1 Tax=Datura stramonium TaxID=4076 RepID=A0ABS8RHJ5_DATST|nr:hypothetical protein [Datura stramonium]